MKKHKKLKILGVVICSIVAFMLLINIIPPSKVVNDNPFLKGDGPVMIAAHRGGAENNPENTMKAFKAAVNEYKVDIIESDLYLTKDGYLVYNHDSYIDKTCNVNGDISYDEMKQLIENKDNRHYIENYDLNELRTFNFGYYFKENENYPYQNVDYIQQDLQIVEASELFEEFYETNKDLKFIVEIKNSGKQGELATKKLITMLKERFPDYLNQIVIGTFHDEIESYLKENYKDVLRGASTGAAAGFIVTEMLKVNIFNNAGFACLQIPREFDLFEVNEKDVSLKLNKKMYIKRAHRRNIAVQYWTINDEQEMKELIELGCDAIMTDNPKLLRKVVDNK